MSSDLETTAKRLEYRMSELEKRLDALVEALQSLSLPTEPVITRGPYTLEERIAAAHEGRVLR